MKSQSLWLFETPPPTTSPYFTPNVQFDLEQELDQESYENEMDWEIGATIDLDKAVAYNRSQSIKIGWQNYVDDIVRLLGFSTYTPDERTFAQAVANWQQKQGLTPDGMIGSKTWATMQKALGSKPAAPKPIPTTGLLYPDVSTLLPQSGIGFRSRTGNRYGIPETIDALLQVGMKWQSKHPTGPLIVISDISKKGGGELRPHKSHRLGLDVDLGLYRSKPKPNGSHRVCTIDPDYKSYWRSLIQDLVNIIRSNGVLKVKQIGFADKTVSGTTHWDDHRCHLHVRFCMLPKYKSRLDLSLTYGKGKKPDYRCSGQT
jgi:hypothetical protein